MNIGRCGRKLLNEEEQREFVILIESGFTKTQICNYFKFGGKPLYRIAKELEICDKLENNNINSRYKNVFTTEAIFEVKKLIESGCGYTQIYEKGYTYRRRFIEIIIQLFSLQEQIKKNNEKYWIQSHRIYWKSVFLEKVGKIKKYSEDIKNIILNNGIKKDINNFIKHVRIVENDENLCFSHVEEIIKDLGLCEKFAKNRTENIKNQAISNWKKVNIQRSIEYKEKISNIKNNIDKDLEDLFIKLKTENVHKKEALKYFKNIYYGYLIYDTLKEKYGKIGHKECYGNKNGMYGVSPPKEAGIGLKGHILIDDKYILFRSSLELKMFVHLSNLKIKFEICKHRIKYIFENKEYTYCPDIVINDCICEIKPKELVNLELNRYKFKALEEYCSKFNLKYEIITDEKYNLSYINMEYVDDLIKRDIIRILDSPKNLIKYEKTFSKEV